MVLVVRLKDVALRGGATAGVLGQVDVGEPDLAKMPPTFLLLKKGENV